MSAEIVPSTRGDKLPSRLASSVSRALEKDQSQGTTIFMESLFYGSKEAASRRLWRVVIAVVTDPALWRSVSR